MAKYITIDAEKKTYLKISVDYQIGGMNWAYNRMEKRGIYVYIRPIERDGSFEKFGMMHDLTGNNIRSNKILVKELGRKSQKQIDKIADILDYDKIGALWIAGDYDQALDLIWSLT
jgi:hypothetical protein